MASLLVSQATFPSFVKASQIWPQRNGSVDCQEAPGLLAARTSSLTAGFARYYWGGGPFRWQRRRHCRLPANVPGAFDTLMKPTRLKNPLARRRGVVALSTDLARFRVGHDSTVRNPFENLRSMTTLSFMRKTVSVLQARGVVSGPTKCAPLAKLNIEYTHTKLQVLHANTQSSGEQDGQTGASDKRSRGVGIVTPIALKLAAAQNEKRKPEKRAKFFIWRCWLACHYD